MLFDISLTHCNFIYLGINSQTLICEHTNPNAWISVYFNASPSFLIKKTIKTNVTINRTKEELSKVSWEILTFKAMTTIFVLMFYFALTFLF